MKKAFVFSAMLILACVTAFSADGENARLNSLYWECRILGGHIQDGCNDELAQVILSDLSDQLNEQIKAATDGFSTQEEFDLFLENLVAGSEVPGKAAMEQLEYWRDQLKITVPSVCDGDIIFHESQSSQSIFIKKATHSKYTHCGVIVHLNGSPYVYEASSSVRFTTLSSFIDRGVGNHYVVKRFNMFYGLSDSDKAKLKTEALKYKGKSYDSLFLWSDSRIYCSELVWKIFDRGIGREVGGLEKFRDMDTDDPDVKAELIRRFGSLGNVPWDEKIITPVSVMKSWKLYTCASD